MLVHLPCGYRPEQVRDALAAKILTLPDLLRRSLTWDQGPEMGKWEQVRIDAGIDVYFCDAHFGPAFPLPRVLGGADRQWIVLPGLVRR